MKLDEHGKQYPRPVIDTKKALESYSPGEAVEALVDSGITVQNLSKVAINKGLSAVSEKTSDNEFSVKIAVDQGVTSASGTADGSDEEPVAYQSDNHKEGMTVVLSSNLMDRGDPELGKALMEGFVYALTQQDALPGTTLLHNGGAYLSRKDSDNLEDLKSLESQGVEILTCGTCLNFYGLSGELQVGSVTNMYEIVGHIATSKLLVRP